MDYGEIFVGTFLTIWRHKVLWLFGILSQILAACIGIIGILFGMRFSALGFEMIRSFSNAPEAPLPFTAQRLLSELAGWYAGFLCLLVFFGLASYIVNLILRGAIIGEAGIAWGGERTRLRRGLRTGAGRGLYVFLLDLMWWLPISLILGGIYLLGILLWIGLIGGMGNANNEAGAGAAALLGCCGLLCCLLLSGLLIAVFFGIFSPLMYQSAVLGRRSLGQAVAEGWHLARTHVGAMLIFWLMVLLIVFLGALILSPFGYLLNTVTRTYWTGVSSWIIAASQALPGSTPPPFPTMPAINLGLVLALALIQAAASLVVNGFVLVFGLTLYAAVYRKLTGSGPAGIIAGPADPAPEPPVELGRTDPLLTPQPTVEQMPSVPPDALAPFVADDPGPAPESPLHA